MWSSNRPSQLVLNEKRRLLDYLIFKLKHGGNVIAALRSYMDNNPSKTSRPVQAMLDEISGGTDFADAALRYGLVDVYGHRILAAGVEPTKALPVIRDQVISSNLGVTKTIITQIAKSWSLALLLGLTIASDSIRQPVIAIFEQMNKAAVMTGGSPEPLPGYLENPWLVVLWTVLIGLFVCGLAAWFWQQNRYHTHRIYRLARFRFYEDWSSLLALYIALKAAGQSDYAAANALASMCAHNSFNHTLFANIAGALRKHGHSFYDSIAEQRQAFPPEILSFLLDASKTGQIDIYFRQAKEYCDLRLQAINELAQRWVPAITGIFFMMVFGLMIADLFVKLTVITIKPLTG